MYDKSIAELILNITTEIISIRRKLHMFPELSLKEFETSQTICDFLDKVGIEYKRVANTGVIGTIINDIKYPTIAIRAEIDALPIQEEKICDYASQNNGVMHACGHDGIIAITLGLARIMNEKKSTLKCNIKFIFEPAEEIGKGAKTLIHEHALENPKVERIIVFHLTNSLPLGMEIQPDVSTAELCSLNIKIKGKSTHWGEYSMGVDAIHAAGKVICAIHDLNNNYKSKMPMIIGIGTVNGGAKNNIVAENVDMKGTLRTFCTEDRNNIIKLLKNRINDIEGESRASIEVDIVPRIPSIYNDSSLVKLGTKIGERVFGKKNIYISNSPFLAGDNAGFYFKEVHGVRIVFFAQRSNEVNYPLHNSKFDFDERIMPLALETLIGVIYDFDKG